MSRMTIPKGYARARTRRVADDPRYAALVDELLAAEHEPEDDDEAGARYR